MADKITPRAQDFSQWYQDVVVQAKLADYSPVKGCMVIRPNGYSIWECIQRDLDARIKASGARNAYFPLFIPESFLKKEAEHVEGFAPQCAVVTYAGAKDLEERLVVRPTSETIINSMFAKWIQSYRDLPFLINQWANVVRWEMRTRLFLRTTEFLWQEGHTCHATPEDAENYSRRMLRVYTQFAEETLAMPVYWGQKSESEKFAGALRTYCIEAMMQDKKALQAGTSHNLADHFAQAFGTKFLDKDSKEKWVHQTSWGVSTRLIGGMIMTHSDDKGLVLPPKLAQTQVVIVPILSNSAKRSQVIEIAHKLKKEIEELSPRLPVGFAGPSGRLNVLVDEDETKQPGWKFHEYELIGIPIRIEVGPRDLDQNQVVATRRDLSQKTPIPLPQVADWVIQNLVQMQSELLHRAKQFRDQNTFEVKSYDELVQKLENPGGFFKISWGGSRVGEEKLKADAKATIRCILLDDQFEALKTDEPCLLTGEKSSPQNPNRQVIVARSY